MTDEYKTITEVIGEGFYSEKRSKFLAFAHHVETIDEIKDILASYRKKYYDARHVCYAYVLGADKADFRANDDGEPSSTAGKPILGQINSYAPEMRGEFSDYRQINSYDLTNVLVIVVRYYGGVNLGTGGLIVAYRTAAADALDHATIETRLVEEVITYSFPYPMMNAVMRVIKEMQPRIVSQTFDNTCSISMSIRQEMAPVLRDRLEKLSFE